LPNREKSDTIAKQGKKAIQTIRDLPNRGKKRSEEFYLDEWETHHQFKWGKR